MELFLLSNVFMCRVVNLIHVRASMNTTGRLPCSVVMYRHISSENLSLFTSLEVQETPSFQMAPKAAFTLAVAFSALLASAATIDKRIVNGVDVKEGEIKFIVSIIYWTAILFLPLLIASGPNLSLWRLEP